MMNILFVYWYVRHFVVVYVMIMYFLYAMAICTAHLL